MGVLEAIARLFGVSKAAPVAGGGGDAAPSGSANGSADGAAEASGGGTATAAAPVGRRPEPVAIDLYTDDEEDDVIGQPMEDTDPAAGGGEALETASPTGALGPAPRNRQELLNELRKNYTEVLGLVRKVDGHLDEQSHRSERLLELAESSARDMSHLPELVEQNRRVADALADLIEMTRDARTRQDAAADRLTKTAIQQLESAQRQTAALQTMQAAMHRAGEADEKVAALHRGLQRHARRDVDLDQGSRRHHRVDA
jgi:hypothetical protein